MIATESQALFDKITYNDIVAGDSETYEDLRTKLRQICAVFDARYVYLYEVDVDHASRTFLFCVAETDEEDAMVQQHRSLGAVSTTPFARQEVEAAEGTFDSDVDTVDNMFGADMCWYLPIELSGSTLPVILGVDFEAEAEENAIWNHTISFTILMVIGFVSIVGLELFVLKKSVSDPLRILSGRMRSFTQDGVLNQEHVAVGTTAEIADIEASFNQMTDDIDGYVGRIAQMCEDRVAVETELEVARRIQSGLVPPTTHCEHDGFDAYAFARTARAVGGDCYLLTTLDNGKLMLVIADVSGKGVSAALFMAMFLTHIHEKLRSCLDPARSLNEANDALLSNNPENMFVTLIAGIFDPSTRTLTFANAGHTPPLVVGKSYLSPDPGIALGLFEDAGIVNETLVLQPGEGVFFYTDGATEAVNLHNKFFGEDRLMQATQEKRDAQSVVHAVVDAVDAFAEGQEQFDDLTLLALFATDVDCADGTDWRATLKPELSSFTELREHIVELCGTGPKAKEAVLACDEAFSNVVHYSGATAVDVALYVANNELAVRIADDGTPFDPLAHEAEDRAFEDFDMGGMGIMLIREACDDIAYEYADGRNVLTLRFNL